jgi:Holliday junction resolvase
MRKRTLNETESDVLKYCTQRLQYLGWLVIRIPPGIYGPKGLPDLYCAKDGYSCWIEVKRRGGKLTQSQIQMHHKLRSAGVDVFVITGIDGEGGAEEIIKRIQHMRCMTTEQTRR